VKPWKDVSHPFSEIVLPMAVLSYKLDDLIFSLVLPKVEMGSTSFLFTPREPQRVQQALTPIGQLNIA
jgi:hypothetical protein